MADRTEFSIVVQRLPDDEGGGFLAYVPDLPGCMSDGATEIEALENARDAIGAWISQARALGREVPEPTRRRVFA